MAAAGVFILPQADLYGRNDARYQNTLDHGKSYDAKNMMHAFRLLDMAAEILTAGRVIVR